MKHFLRTIWLGIRFAIFWCLCTGTIIWLKAKFFPHYGGSGHHPDSFNNFMQSYNAFMDSITQPSSEHYSAGPTNLKSIFENWEIGFIGIFSLIITRYVLKAIDVIWKIFVADFLKRKLIDFKEYFSNK